MLFGEDNLCHLPDQEGKTTVVLTPVFYFNQPQFLNGGALQKRSESALNPGRITPLFNWYLVLINMGSTLRHFHLLKPPGKKNQLR